jgi:hypothetical protein
MRARSSVYHMHCFKCLVCEKQLNTGDEFGIGKDNISILCRAHYTYQPEQHLQPQAQHLPHPPMYTNFNEQNSLQSQFPIGYNNYPVDSYQGSITNDLNLQNNQQPGYGNSMYMCNLPPTPGISPPNSQPFHSQQMASQQIALNHISNDSNQLSVSGITNPTTGTPNASNSSAKGRSKKRKAPASSGESGQSSKKLVKSKQSAANAASSGTTYKAIRRILTCY